MIHFEEIVLPEEKTKRQPYRQIVFPNLNKVINLYAECYKKPIDPSIFEVRVKCPKCDVGHTVYREKFTCSYFKGGTFLTSQYAIKTQYANIIGSLNLAHFNKCDKVGLYYVLINGKWQIVVKDGKGLYKFRRHGHYEYHTEILDGTK